MSNEIITSADILDKAVLNVVNKNSIYVDDVKTIVYYNFLLSKFNIDRTSTNLPALTDLSQVVKDYIVCCTKIGVCYDALAGNLAEFIEGTNNDQWKQKLDAYKEQKTEILNMILESDLVLVTDDDIDDANNANILFYDRG